MAKHLSLRVGDIKLTSGTSGDMESIDEDTPFRILVMANFGGQRVRAGQLPLARRKPILVDRDNFDDVMAKVGAEVTVALGSNPQEQITTTALHKMEDFEPDELFQRLSIFESLRSLNRRLQDPTQFAEAVTEIKDWASPAKIPAPLPPAPAPISQEDLLNQILGAKATARTDTISGESDWNQFLRRIVEPHVSPRTDPRLPDFEAVVNEAISVHMRTLLHHPELQAVEAAWRGLLFLVRRLETDTQLKLYMLDVDKTELAEDLLGVSDLSETGTFRHLVEQTTGTPGAVPWAVAIGLYTFGPDQQDAEVLGNLAKIAKEARAPFLAAANSLIVGCSSLSATPDPRDWHDDANALEAWQQLRQLPEAPYVGLLLPRFLLRLPYGKDFTTTERFDFEEMPTESSHESYLWGNPALACALLLGQSFSQSGWNLRLGEHLEIDGLPLHVCLKEGERVAKPCAEVLLTNRAAERILEMGLMPLLSQQGEGSVRLVQYQSVAAPPRPLAGRWQ